MTLTMNVPCERCGSFEQVLASDPIHGDVRIPCPACGGTGSQVAVVGAATQRKLAR